MVEVDARRRRRDGRTCGTSPFADAANQAPRRRSRCGEFESRRSRARGGARATTDALTELASVIVPSAEAIARD